MTLLAHLPRLHHAHVRDGGVRGVRAHARNSFIRLTKFLGFCVLGISWIVSIVAVVEVRRAETIRER